MADPTKSPQLPQEETNPGLICVGKPDNTNPATVGVAVGGAVFYNKASGQSIYHAVANPNDTPIQEDLTTRLIKDGMARLGMTVSAPSRYAPLENSLTQKQLPWGYDSANLGGKEVIAELGYERGKGGDPDKLTSCRLNIRDGDKESFIKVPVEQEAPKRAFPPLDLDKPRKTAQVSAPEPALG